MLLLQADKLVKTYGGRTVVNQVCFHVNDGEIVGLLGRNGAGKTTSFRMTVGMIAPDGGGVRFLDRDVTGEPMYRRARLGMGYLSQEPSIFQKLTVEQNLRAICETVRLSRRQRRDKIEDLIEQFSLQQVRHNLARTVSGGERRKLEIARALITNPRLILLDEPFSGVDPIAVEGLRHEIHRLRERGIAILLTDHNVHEAFKVTDRSYVIDQGRVIADGTPHELVNNRMVRESYLGNSFRGDEFAPPGAMESPIDAYAPRPVTPAMSADAYAPRTASPTAAPTATIDAYTPRPTVPVEAPAAPVPPKAVLLTPPPTAVEPVRSYPQPPPMPPMAGASQAIDGRPHGGSQAFDGRPISGSQAVDARPVGGSHVSLGSPAVEPVDEFMPVDPVDAPLWPSVMPDAKKPAAPPAGSQLPSRDDRIF